MARWPLTYNFIEPISPLRFAFNGIDLLYEMARFPLPVSVGPMVQCGMSGPATLAGTIAQENAEISRRDLRDPAHSRGDSCLLRWHRPHL